MFLAGFNCGHRRRRKAPTEAGASFTGLVRDGQLRTGHV